MSPRSTTDARAGLEARRRELWALAYRMTGCPAEAEDIVQETYARALTERHEGEHLRAWAFRVCTNLSIDAQRARRRRRYVGPDLPTPVDLEAWLGARPSEEADVEARYQTRESLSYAFVAALDRLGPKQRAVLVLRDVLGLSVRETAAAIGASEVNVKVLHHRARAAMADYDRAHEPAESRGRAPGPTTEALLVRLLGAIATHDATTIAALLAEPVETRSDAAGAFTAARRPVVGREKVALFWSKMGRGRTVLSVSMVSANGAPAVRFELAPTRGHATTMLLLADFDRDGRALRVDALFAEAKLGRLRPPATRGPAGLVARG
jgi:RNA polymerase sigma-70 factor (ECF subfamily)